jgi:hypothetical protein
MEWWKKKVVVLKVLMKYIYLKLLQKMYITVCHLHKNNYEIQYVLHDKIYKFRTKVKRGPSRLFMILDHEANDVTDEVRSYMGPNEDFHGQSVCPRDMGYEKLHVCLRSGGEIYFNADQPIIL